MIYIRADVRKEGALKITSVRDPIRIITGSFPGTLEREFLQEYKQRTLRFVRAGLAVAIILFAASNAWDYSVDPHNAWKAGIIRGAVSVQFFLTLLLTLWPAWFFRLDQLAMAANCVIAAIGCLAILSLLDGGAEFAISNLLLVYMYIFGFIRLLFPTAVACGFMIIGIYNLAMFYNGFDASALTPNNYLLLCGVLIGATTTRLLEGSARRHFLTRRALQAEKKRTDDLILSIFPPEIAKRLHAGEKVIADSHGEGTVVFADLVGFTDLARRFSPTHVVEVLNDLFSMMDRLVAKHGVEKIKTIGDAYMAASGVTTWAPDSAERIAEFALELVEQLGDYAKQHNYPIAVRVGVATGQVVSGVIGSTKPSFDLWGDTVNLASRMEQQSDAGTIQVSEATYWRLQEKFQFEKRGIVVAKGIGEVQAFLLRGRKPPLRLIDQSTGATAR